jgi:hypothetical protein
MVLSGRDGRFRDGFVERRLGLFLCSDWINIQVIIESQPIEIIAGGIAGKSGAKLLQCVICWENMIRLYKGSAL